MAERPLFYVLDGHEVVPAADAHVWAKWFEKTSRDRSRYVAQTRIGQFRVSTVFLGLDHNPFGAEPEIFETMIFDLDGDDSYQERCSTWKKAELQHAIAVETIKNQRQGQQYPRSIISEFIDALRKIKEEKE